MLHLSARSSLVITDLTSHYIETSLPYELTVSIILCTEGSLDTRIARQPVCDIRLLYYSRVDSLCDITMFAVSI